MKDKVLFWTRKPHTISDADMYRLQKRADVICIDVAKNITEEEVIEKSKGMAIVISTWGAPYYTKRILENCDKLELLACIGGTIKGTIDSEAFNRGIKIITAVDAQGKLLADLTVSLILAGLHRFPFYTRQQWGGGTLSDLNSMKEIPQHTIVGKNISLMGFGNIARHVVTMLKPFNCAIKAYDPYVQKDVFKEMNVKQVDNLEELCLDCDVLSLHLTMNEKTKGILNKELIELLKPGMLLVNTSYGELIDQSALEKRLADGSLFACLDMVVGGMPDAFNKLRYYPNCMITPIISGNSDGVASLMGKQIVDEILRFLDGEELKFEVEKETLAFRA